MRGNSNTQRNLTDLMKGLLAVAVVVAAFGVAALWVAKMGQWAAPEPAAAAAAEVVTTAVPIVVAATPVLEPTADPQPDVAPEATEGVELAPTEPIIAEDPLPSGEPAAGFEYVVREGDTLSAIAARHGLTAEELAAANSLDNPDYVIVGQTLRIPAEGNPLPVPSEVPADLTLLQEARWIDVDLSEQRVTAYEGQTAVRTTLVSTGLPATPTPEGQYRVYVMFRYDDMAGPGYYIKDVPFVMYFYEGYGLHGVTWHGNFGHPMSHGCVNLPTAEAEWLFGWAEVGTLVNVHS